MIQPTRCLHTGLRLAPGEHDGGNDGERGERGGVKNRVAAKLIGEVVLATRQTRYVGKKKKNQTCAGDVRLEGGE